MLVSGYLNIYYCFARLDLINIIFFLKCGVCNIVINGGVRGWREGKIGGMKWKGDYEVGKSWWLRLANE